MDFTINQSTSGVPFGIQYRMYPNGFIDDVSGSVGPTPGAFQVTTAGVDADLSELTTPGYCIIRNLDTEIDGNNFIEWGIWDGTKFYPIGELAPGHFCLFKLSRNLGVEYGTGSTSLGTGNTLRLKANLYTCFGAVEAFET